MIGGLPDPRDEWWCRKYVVKQLAARLRPQLEAVVKQNESAAGDSFVPGDFNQVSKSSNMQPFESLHCGQ